jgi:signal transduction histidine kinase
MSSLGQLVAGVAHEITNPIRFVAGNVGHAIQYSEDLLNLIKLYAKHYPQPVLEIQKEIEAIEVEFLIEDFPRLLASMKMGADRIVEIVRSLRTFSRLDEATMKMIDIHEGIDSTLLILQNRLKCKAGHPEIIVVKVYGNLPRVRCYPGQINQVFMNILTNAIDALDDYKQDQPNTITIHTEVLDENHILIRIKDNGPGMIEYVKAQLFDPFFTTKPIGQGTGLGLSISYQIIVEKHNGQLKCISAPGEGTEFLIEIPIRQ